MPKKSINRRSFLKLLAAGGGIVAFSPLPTRWSKPKVNSSHLSVHAQTSAPVPPELDLYDIVRDPSDNNFYWKDDVTSCLCEEMYVIVQDKTTHAPVQGILITLTATPGTGSSLYQGPWSSYNETSNINGSCDFSGLAFTPHDTCDFTLTFSGPDCTSFVVTKSEMPQGV